MKIIYHSLTIFLLIFTSCKNDVNEELLPGKIINQTLQKNEKHLYSVTLDKDEYFEMTVTQQGIDLNIAVLDEDNNTLMTFDSPQNGSSPEFIKFISPRDGLYIFVISALYEGQNDSISRVESEEIKQGSYNISSVNILTAPEFQIKKSEIQNVVSLFKDYAHPLKGVTPGIGFEDLDFLKPILKDVLMVGLGEATHGTREFFQMKSRMLEFLVKEMGFTVFAIEASFAACNNINDYVLNGKGDAHTALASQGFWTLDTEEVIDMIEWMRTYNQSVPENRKVKFLGFDIQYNKQGFNLLQNYLKKVDLHKASQTKQLFSLLRRMEIIDTAFINTDSCKQEFQNLIEFMIMNKESYIQESSPDEYEFAFRHAKVIEQFFDAFFFENFDIVTSDSKRDNYMASNFEYIVKHEQPGTKFVVWAHNGHIQKYTSKYYKPFGSYLMKLFGDAYYAFGFSFSKGSYQSIENTTDNMNSGIGLQEFTVGEAKKYSLDWYFSQTGLSKFIINFRDSNLLNLLKAFSIIEPYSRSIGSVSVREYSETYYTPVNVENDFDGMIFIDNTTRARPTPTGMRK